ncbi:MAG: hypothetical protein SGBAC_005186 [Bacillariaceae sp.]
MTITAICLSRVTSLVLLCILLQIPNVQAQECLNVDKPSINGTQRQYLLGGHSWHRPVLEYLNDVVGQQFDPPISFTWTTQAGWLNAPTVKDALARGFDFIVTNSYRSSCFEAEGKAITLATERIVSKDPDTGMLFNITQFGAALYTLSNRTDIQTVTDVIGKKIATNRYSNLATHLCYDVLLRNDVHNLQDPEQIIYFSSSSDALGAVLDGQMDVGCAAASTLEFYKDSDTGERLDMSRIRILGEQQHVINGAPYPFKMSSPLVPTPLFQAFPHVEPIVMEKVQTALLAMGDHADAAPALLACLEERLCLSNNTVCADACFQSLPQGTIQRCDTTAELALKAHTAIGTRLFGYTKPQQNLDMVFIEQSTGFLVRDPSPRCVRFQTIVEAVTCPSGHFARSGEHILKQCNISGLECYGRDCLCSPCAEAFDVDFIVTSDDDALSRHSFTGSGCSKFSQCGEVEQGSSVSFLAFDNKKRQNITMRGAFLLSDDSRDDFTLDLINGTFQYDFHVPKTRVGYKLVIIEVCEQNELCQEIPESPFRINVMPPKCPKELFGVGREADEWGVCHCKSGRIEIGGNCTSVLDLVMVSLVVILLLTLVSGKLYIRNIQDEKQNDMLWTVKRNELRFSSPPEIVGRGTFGLVLLAEYRGTQVAVKRVIPAKSRAAVESKDDYWDPQDKTDRTGKESTERYPSQNCGPRPNNAGLQSGSSVSRRVNDVEIGSNKRSWQKLRTNFVEEMRILSKLRHPCICTVMGMSSNNWKFMCCCMNFSYFAALFGFCTEGAVIGNNEEPMLVMEYMDYGSLHDLLKNDTMSINEEIILPILRDISQGVRFLHSADPPVIHGDLKAANILVDRYYRAKVADFGLSQKKQLRGTGTPYWMAPELLRNETSQTAASDVFSFGVVLVEVFSRKDPYEGEDAEVVLKKVADKSSQKRPLVPETCPSQIQSMIADCLVDKAACRPDFEEIDTRLKRIDTSAAAALTSVENNNTANQADFGAGLFDRFPKHIAKALQEGRQIEPEHRDCVTIFFCDIADSDNNGSKLSSRKVVDLLDRLHSKFDALAEDHDVFKVETIGDSYMVVANLVKDQRNFHVKRIADFSIAAIAAAKTTLIDVDDESKGLVSIQCGFHSGPVVADVVGTKSPRYCLLGDTVNTASLMETKSSANRIHCSAKASKLLKQQYPSMKILSRGMIPIKGKGVMDTYWVDESNELCTPITMRRQVSEVVRQVSEDDWSADAFSSIETA